MHLHRLSVVLLAVGLAVLGSVLYVMVAYLAREHPGAKSLSSAARNLPGVGSTMPGAAAVRYPPPPSGVYRLQGSGSEHISFPPNSQQDSAVMPGSVSLLAGGCWRWHQDYNVAHWDEYDFCPSGDTLLQMANRNSQSWDFGTFTVRNLARFTCDPAEPVLPAGATPGTTVEASCTGRNSSIPGTTTARTTLEIGATTTLDVGGARVAAIHETQHTTLSGTQSGTVVMDWWFAQSNGLPLRVERHITIATQSPIGAITYTESGSWQVASLRPRH